MSFPFQDCLSYVLIPVPLSQHCIKTAMNQALQHYPVINFSILHSYCMCMVVNVIPTNALCFVFLVCLVTMSAVPIYRLLLISMKSEDLRSHGDGAAHAGLQGCDAVSSGKQSVTFRGIIVSLS